MTPLEPAALAPLFRPRSLAVIGASDKSYFSRNVVSNLVAAGFGDRLHLVNRRGGIVHDRLAVPSLAAIGEPVDLAFVMLPRAATADALAEAAAAGVRGAVVMSSGYAEVGPAGRAAQEDLAARARELGIVLLGPNVLGFANFVDRIPVTPILNLPSVAGSVALLSQSGASSSAMLEFATTAGVGLSYLVTLGNEAMVTAGHVVDYLVDDRATRALAIFLETVRDPEVFRAAARRARAAGKAVVVLKAGRSALAARTAAAHTGAFVGDDAVVDAVFRDLGVIRVDTIEDLLVTAGAAAELGPLRARGVGVVSISGGACDIVADLAERAGLPLPEPAKGTVAALAAALPDYGRAQNPLDVTGAAVLDPGLGATCVEAMGTDPSIGAVLAVNRLPWQPHEDPFAGQPFVDAIGKGAQAADVPVVFVNQVMQPITAVTRRALERAGLSYAICGLSQAVTALSRLGWWSSHSAPTRSQPRGLSLPPTADRRGQWSETRARDLLAAAGVPVVPGVLVRTPDEAAAAAAQLGGPVAVKLVSPQVLHKSDIGGVRLGVTGADTARAAFTAVTAAAGAVPGAVVEGALVAPMRAGGLELLVGAVRDPQWGPMLAVAFGGVLVEVLRDSALTPLPAGPERICELLAGLRGSALFGGLRGAQPADLDDVVAAIVAVGELAWALGDDLESLEVNPLRVDGRQVEALDAVVTWRAGAEKG